MTHNELNAIKARFDDTDFHNAMFPTAVYLSLKDIPALLEALESAEAKRDHWHYSYDYIREQNERLLEALKAAEARADALEANEDAKIGLYKSLISERDQLRAVIKLLEQSNTDLRGDKPTTLGGTYIHMTEHDRVSNDRDRWRARAEKVGTKLRGDIIDE